MAAVPAMAKGIVGPAFTGDMTSAVALGLGAIAHTFSLILLGSLFVESGRQWS